MMIPSLARSTVRLMSAVVIGAVTGIVVALLLPRSYEAVAFIDIGKIGHIGQVEPTAAVLTRINSRTFKLGVIEAAGYNSKENGAAEDYLDSMFAAPLPRSDLVEVKSTGKTEDEARQLLSEILRQLKEIHDGIAKPEVDVLRVRLTAIESELATLQNAQTPTPNQSGRDSAGSYFVASLWREVVFQEQRYKLELERFKLQQDLGPSRTRPTRFLHGISTRRKPATGRMALLGLIGALLGSTVFLLGMTRVSGLRTS